MARPVTRNTARNLERAIAGYVIPGQFGETAAAPDIIKLLDDERPGVRRAAARALGRMRVRAALEQLENLAKEDASESVKLSAAAAAWLIKAATG